VTELTAPDEAAQQSPDWPALDIASIGDPVVEQALTPLETLPGKPVGEHEAVYARLHDELLAALDVDPEAGRPPQHGSAPMPGPPAGGGT
jgi:hypothetical protein